MRGIMIIHIQEEAVAPLLPDGEEYVSLLVQEIGLKQTGNTLISGGGVGGRGVVVAQ